MDKIRSLIVGIGWFVHNRPNDLTGSLMQEIERLPLSEEFIRSFSSMTEKDVIQDSEKRRIFLEEAESVKDYLLIQHPKVAAEINTTWRRVVSVH